MHHPHNTPLLSADPQATAARSPVREVRHPNSVTAPPVHRGSMPALPWQQIFLPTVEAHLRCRPMLAILHNSTNLWLEP